MVSRLVAKGADIFLHSLPGKNFLADTPRYNLAFRIIEAILFISFTWMYIIQQRYIMAAIMSLVSGGIPIFFIAKEKV